MKKRSIIAAAVMILFLLSVMALPSFAFVSYNAGAPIFWKSGIQGLYVASDSNFLQSTNGVYQIPESSLSSSNGLYFDSEYLSNYHDKYVDEGDFHFAFEQLNFYLNSPSTTFIYPVSSLNTYLVFDRILYVDPGETVQFYVVPMSNRWKVTYDNGSSYSWYYFNLLDSVNFGSYDPMRAVNQFIDDTVLTYDISVVATTVYNNNLPRNVYQVRAKNESSATVTCDGLRFKFAPSNNNTNEPYSYPSFQPYTADIDAFGLNDFFSNVIKWVDSTETDVILNELAQIRAQNNRLIEIDEGIASGISDVNSGVQDLVDIWSETADYSDVEPDHSYSPDIPESEAIAEWGAFLDEADDILYSSDVRDSASFWQRTLTYLLNLPGVLTIAALTTFLLGARALLGR